MRLLILSAILIPSLTWAAEPTKATSDTKATTPSIDEPILRPGTEEKPAPPPATAAKSAAYDEDERLRFGLGLFYFGGDKLAFKNVETATAGKMDVDFKLDTSWGFLVSVQYLPTDSWGFIASMDFEQSRKIKSTSSSGTLTFDGSGDKMTILTMDGNLAYRWQKLYFPFGFNISGAAYKADTSGANIKTIAGFGIQGGVGYMITQNLAADLMVKAISFGFDQDLGGPKTSYNSGVMPGVFTSLRFIF